MPRRKWSGRAGATGVQITVAVGDPFQRMAQKLENVQEALRLQKREMENMIQEALHLQVQDAKEKFDEVLRQRVQEVERRMQETLHTQQQEAELRMQEALCLQEKKTERKFEEVLRRQEQELERLQESFRQHELEEGHKVQEALHLHRRIREALRLQEQRATTALREMQRKLLEKDDVIHALQQRLEQTQERVTAVEERTTAPEESAGDGGLQGLEDRVEKVEASLQSAVQTFLPRVEVLLRQLEKSDSRGVSLATAASTSVAIAREAPATGGAAAGGGEDPPSSTPTPTTSDTGHQGAAADEKELARQRVERRVREVRLKMEMARTSPSPRGEQLHKTAEEGSLRDVHRLLDSGADVNYTGRDGFTPLINANLGARVDVVSLLLQRGADANAVTSCGDSALHFAASRDFSGRCVELLVGAGSDVDARDENGETPLHRAARVNNEKTVRALLAAGARKDLRAWDRRWKDKTPFEIARSSRIQDLLL